MKISVEWLKEYIDIPETPEKLQEDLSMKGLLVEGLTKIPGGDTSKLRLPLTGPIVSVTSDLPGKWVRSMEGRCAPRGEKDICVLIRSVWILPSKSKMPISVRDMWAW
jgi:hypothetical protein